MLTAQDGLATLPSLLTLSDEQGEQAPVVPSPALGMASRMVSQTIPVSTALVGYGSILKMATVVSTINTLYNLFLGRSRSILESASSTPY